MGEAHKKGRVGGEVLSIERCHAFMMLAAGKAVLVFILSIVGCYES
jgi:hypothetical protein